MLFQLALGASQLILPVAAAGAAVAASAPATLIISNLFIRTSFSLLKPSRSVPPGAMPAAGHGAGLRLARHEPAPNAPASVPLPDRRSAEAASSRRPAHASHHRC